LGLQGDPLTDDPELVIVIHARIYQLKQFTRSYEGRHGGNWIIEDVEIGFPVPGDSGQHAPSPQMAGGIK
jgi:hypothetical protein